MRIKKIFKYTGITIFILLVASYFLAERELTKIFGGLTERATSAQFVPENVPIIVQNTHLLSPDGNSFVPNQSVLILNGKIARIDSIIDDPEVSITLDAQGKYLIPGFIDSHVHFYGSSNDLLLYLANGITQVGELDGRDEHLAWREEIREGKRAGPKMYIASPRTGSFNRLQGIFIHWTQGMRIVNHRKDAAALIEEMSEKGYDGIKLYGTLNSSAYQAISKLAPLAGLDVVGHIPFAIPIDTVLISNQISIAHLEELMRPTLTSVGGLSGIKNQEEMKHFLTKVEENIRPIAPLLAEKDVPVVTTLWLMKAILPQMLNLENLLMKVELEYANPGISEWQEEIPGLGWLPKVNRYKNRFPLDMTLEEKEKLSFFWKAYEEGCMVIMRVLHENGVKVLAGTDANVPVAVPGFSFHDELLIMHKAGMNATETLKAATLYPGEFLGQGTGKIAEGYSADLVLLEKNPLENIEHTKSIYAVFANGLLYDRKKLDEMLEVVKEANDRSRTINIDEFINEAADNQ